MFDPFGKLNYKKYLDEIRQHIRKEVESELLQKFRNHRIALQEYSEKLKSRESAFLEKERQIEKKERESIAKLKIALEAYKEDCKSYEIALYKTENRIIDWLKRVDNKERSAFDEIRRDQENFAKYGSTVAEDGFQFEEQCGAILIGAGYSNVIVTQKSNDFGADITAEKDGVKYVIQCKYYTSPVGVEAVQQIVSARMHYSAHVAVVMTNSVFTKSAKVLAEETGTILWDGEKLHSLVFTESS